MELTAWILKACSYATPDGRGRLGVFNECVPVWLLGVVDDPNARGARAISQSNHSVGSRHPVPGLVADKVGWPGVAS